MANATLSQAKKLVIRALKAGIVPLLRSSPGMGKSALYHEVAEEFNLFHIDLRLAGIDPTGISGFPVFDLEKNIAKFVPLEYFPTDKTPLPSRMVAGKMKKYSGWLLTLDEITSAAPATQAACYQLILDRAAGLNKLHDLCFMVAAGNLESDNAIVEDMSTALKSRVMHINITLSVEEFLDWAYTNKVDNRITSFINWKQLAGLTNFDPNSSDDTYACSRTWGFLDKLINGQVIAEEEMYPLVCSTIGDAMGAEFNGFCNIYLNLPKISDILKDPENFPMPKGVDVQYALTGALAAATTTTNIGSVIKFIERMGAEMQMITFREIIKRDPKLATGSPEFTVWRKKFTQHIHG